MSQPESQERKPHWTAISVALFVIGLLILVPAGLCTLIAGSMFVVDPSNADASLFFVVLLFGGVPMAAGAVLVWAGLKARRRD